MMNEITDFLKGGHFKLGTGSQGSSHNGKLFALNFDRASRALFFTILSCSCLRWLMTTRLLLLPIPGTQQTLSFHNIVPVLHQNNHSPLVEKLSTCLNLAAVFTLLNFASLETIISNWCLFFKIVLIFNSKSLL